MVVLSVSDTGCGISAEKMDELFEPRFTTEARRGIGLGLAVSRNLEVNAGSTEAEIRKGDGSTFVVTLPTKEAVS